MPSRRCTGARLKPVTARCRWAAPVRRVPLKSDAKAAAQFGPSMTYFANRRVTLRSPAGRRTIQRNSRTAISIDRESHERSARPFLYRANLQSNRCPHVSQCSPHHWQGFPDHEPLYSLLRDRPTTPVFHPRFPEPRVCANRPVMPAPRPRRRVSRAARRGARPRRRQRGRRATRAPISERPGSPSSARLRASRPAPTMRPKRPILSVDARLVSS